MDLDFDTIKKNAEKLEKAGFDVCMLELHWLVLSENTEWLMAYKELYEHYLYEVDCKTKEVSLSEELLKIKIKDLKWELEAIRRLYDKPVPSDRKESLLEQYELALTELEKRIPNSDTYNSHKIAF